MQAVSFKWVFVGGMIRSGSTLQYQILSDLVANDLGGTALGFQESSDLDAFLAASEKEAATRFPCVVKSHVCTAGIRDRLDRGEAVAFYTYRDIRDVVVSGSRSFAISIDDFINGRLIDEAIGEGVLWRSHPSVHTSSFETLVGDTSAWIADMMGHLGIAPVSAGRVGELAEGYSIGRQKERLQSAAFSEVQGYAIDPATLLHEKHINEAAVEGWRKALSASQVREIELRAGDWMRENEYQADTPQSELTPEVILPALRRRMAIYFQQSDRILLERENLIRRQALEPEKLRARLIELDSIFKKAMNQPQNPLLWLRLQYRRVLRKLGLASRTES